MVAMISHDRSRIIEDIGLEERLEAMVDRAMRRFAQMKFMKQISDQARDS